MHHIHVPVHVHVNIQAILEDDSLYFKVHVHVKFHNRTCDKLTCAHYMYNEIMIFKLNHMASDVEE